MTYRETDGCFDVHTEPHPKKKPQKDHYVGQVLKPYQLNHTVTAKSTFCIYCLCAAGGCHLIGAFLSDASQNLSQ